MHGELSFAPLHPAKQCFGSYITIPQGVHCQQVIAMPQLKLHHLLGPLQVIIVLLPSAALLQKLQDKKYYPVIL